MTSPLLSFLGVDPIGREPSVRILQSIPGLLSSSRQTNRCQQFSYPTIMGGAMGPQSWGWPPKSPTSSFPGSNFLPQSAVHGRAYRNWTSNYWVAGVLWPHIPKPPKLAQLSQFPLVKSGPNLHKTHFRYLDVLMLEIGKIWRPDFEKFQLYKHSYVIFQSTRH